MTVYLGFAGSDYEEQGGLSDLVAIGVRLAGVQRRCEQHVAPHFIDASPAISVEELLERRAARAAAGARGITTHVDTSDSIPAECLSPIGARPKRVEAVEWAQIARVSTFGRVERSSLWLVDEGEWAWHFAWDDFAPVEVDQ